MARVDIVPMGSSAIGLVLVHIGGIIRHVSHGFRGRSGSRAGWCTDGASQSANRLFQLRPGLCDALVRLLEREDLLVVLDDRADRALAGTAASSWWPAWQGSVRPLCCAPSSGA